MADSLDAKNSEINNWQKIYVQFLVIEKTHQTKLNILELVF